MMIELIVNINIIKGRGPLIYTAQKKKLFVYRGINYIDDEIHRYRLEFDVNCLEIDPRRWLHLMDFPISPS